jgi:hypothetical protein
MADLYSVSDAFLRDIVYFLHAAFLWDLVYFFLNPVSTSFWI